MTDESKRQLHHIFPLAFAFLLRYLTFMQAFLLSAAAVTYAFLVAKRVAASCFRPDELARGYSMGMICYATAVVGLILVFHDRMHIAAGAWAAMSLGDGVSNLAGRAWGGRSLPWNRNKTWVGTLFFLPASWLGILVLILWTAGGKGIPLPGTGYLAAACAAASATGALVESLPLRINDNLTVPAAAAAVLAWLV